MEYSTLKNLHCKLLLQSPILQSKIKNDEELATAFGYLINGQYLRLLNIPIMRELVFEHSSILELTKILVKNKNPDICVFINRLVEQIFSNLCTIESTDVRRSYILIIAVLFLQFFVELNFTGPKLPFEPTDSCLGFIGILSNETINNSEFKNLLQFSSLDMLSIGGSQPYHLLDSPLYLILSLRLFEVLQGSNFSLLDNTIQKQNSDFLVEQSAKTIKAIKKDIDIVLASTCWWRTRALQVQQALLPEYSADLTSLSLKLLSNTVVSTFIDHENINSEVNQKILLSYHLENSKNAISGDLETQTIESLSKAKTVSGLSLVLTGCKARMTRFQTKSVATLTVLAKSQDTLLRSEQEEESFNPQDIKLNDDLFLERPEFESIGDDALFKQEENGGFTKEENLKRIKIDFSNISPFESSNDNSDKLLPIAVLESSIPKILTELNPNNQPALANLDNVQLMLRMQAILSNTPMGNNLVNEELIALVQRILFSPEASVNWLIFARALWSRSLLETARARTVERGVLQLYSLVEELGVTSEETARLFPKTKDEINFPNEFRNLSQEINDKVLTNSIRLRYVYLLPLMPKWSMDIRLAEKLVELGSLKSALEIYERLEQWADAAICYSSTGDSAKANTLIKKAIEQNPKDARSWSILGDIEGDPKYWYKAWDIGRYANAKRSLAKYFYNPPKESGITRDAQKAIDHMYDCLCANPISFQNWYFYGCLGLEISNYKLAAEAFTRCVTIDETSAFSWSNLSSALIQMDKLSEAFHALSKAVNAGDTAKKSWKIWENYLIVAVKLGKWDDVLYASVVLLNAKKDLDQKEGSLDVPILEKLAELLISEPFDEDKRLTHFQTSCIDFICNMVPSVVNHDARCWRIIAKVNMWRRKPWLALENYEKAYRAITSNPDLTSNEILWNHAVEACFDLVSAYENFGDLPGRHGAGDLVCKDWRFKAKSSIRSLISKGKASWENTDSYERLQELKKEIMKA